jgi:hypothetical protein
VHALRTSGLELESLMLNTASTCRMLFGFDAGHLILGR